MAKVFKSLEEISANIQRSNTYKRRKGVIIDIIPDRTGRNTVHLDADNNVVDDPKDAVTSIERSLVLFKLRDEETGKLGAELQSAVPIGMILNPRSSYVDEPTAVFTLRNYTYKTDNERAGMKAGDETEVVFKIDVAPQNSFKERARIAKEMGLAVIMNE